VIGAMQDAHFDAVLEYIAPKGTVENGATVFSIKAAVQVHKDGGFIRSGYSANGEVITQKVDSVIAVPEFALEFAGDTAFVYIENGTNKKEKFKKTPIKVGLSDGFYVQVIEGLAINTKIRGKAK
jgi:HlyD family secretion protein